MIALGTRVRFIEVAYVVRKPSKSDRWETSRKGNFTAVSMITWPDDTTEGRFLAPVKDTNKNVIALPSSGSGVVVGLERKLIGKSVAGGGVVNTYSGESEYEQGWFESKSHVDLYVVRSELRGPSFYVPEESLTVLP